jgi:predicted ArsR family transcriptional regulator
MASLQIRATVPVLNRQVRDFWQGERVLWERRREVQTTRKAILEILRRQGQATVEELAEELELTPMTIRHHLNVLKAQNTVSTTRLRHSRSVGRPRQVYALTQEGNNLFPSNYHELAEHLLDEMKEALSGEQLRNIFGRIGEKLASEAPDLSQLPLEERVSRAVDFLCEKGYLSRWEETDDGYALHQYNCPYRHVAHEHGEVCALDKTFISRLVAVDVERVFGKAAEGKHCTYLVPFDLTSGEK